ncbi:MAG TPA: ATP-binding protein [Ferruginibacter sp.]|nr:ATP-binding protein [Ferruginibacter sp.]
MSLTKKVDVQSFDFFKPLFSSAKQNTVILLDTNGKILDINPAFTGSFGYSREVIGMNFSMLFTEEDQQKDRPQIELSTVLDKGQAYDNNYLVNKSGKIVWVSGESLLVKNDNGDKCIVKIIQDIHEKKEADESIIRLNETNESILKSIEDMVIVLDSDMNVTKANHAFYKLFHLNRETINFAAVILPYDDNRNLVNKLQYAFDTKICFSNAHLEIAIDENDKKIFSCKCIMMQQSVNQHHVLLTAHDITIEKLLERNREDIIGFVAHELKNPLSTIILYNNMIENLLKENKAGEISNYIDKSNNSIRRLNNIIAELYEDTLNNSGNLILKYSAFPALEFLQEAIETIRVTHPESNLAIKSFKTTPIKGDKYKLIQVLTNYLDNAIKYSAPGTAIIIDIQQKDKQLIVSVKDNGKGIPKDEVPYVFERFFRAKKTKNLQGIGLGLHLSKQIINAHKGVVWVQSEEGNGSTFYFSIPV